MPDSGQKAMKKHIREIADKIRKMKESAPKRDK